MIPSSMPNWREYREVHPQGPASLAGRLWILEGVESPQLGNRRDLLVHAPPPHAGSSRRYPVLYMHDGQNLFDPRTSFSGDWGVSGTLERLVRDGIEAIVVGVPNAGAARLDEYSPFRGGAGRGGRGDDYLAFLVDTVKPLVDASFPTLPGPRSTGLVGSSLGGLISLYGVFARPSVFGLCGALSPALRFGKDAIFRFVARSRVQHPRIYLDVGTREASHVPRDRLLGRFLSRRYAGRVRRMHDLLIRMGFQPGEDLLYVEEEDGRHQEAAWARRLPEVLRFLLSPARAAAVGYGAST